MQEQLERFRLHQPAVRHIVDDYMREVGLPGHRAKRGELGRRKADDEIRAAMPARHSFEHRLFRALGQIDLCPQL